MRRALASLLVLGLAMHGAAPAQQAPDRDYRPPIAKPRYAEGKGPVVCVDEAHHNFHTLGERFFAFGELLRRDGFRLRPLAQTFAAASLAPCDVLVISNAQPDDGRWDDYPYPTPSAFTPEEVEAVQRWVRDGGSLLLIADHMPLAGAAAGLAAAFQVEFVDGFARREPATHEPDLFTREHDTLRDHAITRGDGEPVTPVTAVRTFTGQAFRAPDVEPLLVFPAGYVQLLPEKAWRFAPDTRRVAVEGWLQGAVKRVGKGRAAFFGEAAMFSAQLAGPDQEPMGMNSPGAEQNHQLVLNLLHWLTGTL